MTKQRIIITGASGFIGTNLLDKLVKDGNSLLNIDIIFPGKESTTEIRISNYKEMSEAAFKIYFEYLTAKLMAEKYIRHYKDLYICSSKNKKLC
jgi:nucleoside-diphosphate-sugar epimerase